MSKLEVDAIEPQSGTTLTIGASGDSVTLGSGASLTSPGLTLSDNILFNAASKGIYLGVTTPTASNLLDDYEEGTWTPTYIAGGTDFTSVSYAVRTANYVKIGKNVFVSCHMSTSSITKGSASGAILVGGLPFNADGQYGFIIAYARFFLGEIPISGLTRGSGFDQINLYYRTTASTLTAPLQVSDIDTGSGDNDIYFSGTYTTSA